MIATMNAPVATNKWNFRLTTKKTTNGPSSVVSLNSGCGVVLSMLAFNPCDSLREIPRGERRQIVDTLADADEMHRQSMLLRQRDQNAAARRAVEFRHHEAGDTRGTMKRLDLRQRILSHRGVQHQQHRMRSRYVDLFDDAHDFFKLVHQL